MNMIDAYINNNHLRLKLSNTPVTLRNGLMFVNYLPDLHGMLFVFKEVSIKNIWMRNTVISLDILFINSDKKIVNLHNRAIPRDETNVNSIHPCKYIIELPGGNLEEYNIKIGDIVSF